MITTAFEAAFSGVLLRPVMAAAYMGGSGSDDGYGHMSGYGMGFFGAGHWLVGILVIVLFAALIAGFVRLFSGSGSTKSRGRDAMAELDLLYAKGNVSQEEYLRKKSDIAGE